MAKMVTRTFATHTIHATGYKRMEDGSKQEVMVEPLVVNETSMTDGKAVKLLVKRDSSMSYLINSIETEAVTYGMDEDFFIANAKKI